MEGLCGFAAGEAERRLEGEEGECAGVAYALGQMGVEIKRGEGSGRGFAGTDYVGGRDEELLSRAGRAEDASAGPAVVLATGEGSKRRSAARAIDGFDVVDPSPEWSWCCCCGDVCCRLLHGQAVCVV